MINISDTNIDKVVQSLADVAKHYGMTAVEATQAINNLAIFLQEYGYAIPESYERVIDELRPALAQKTENPNQKSDLEIFPINTNKDKKVILEAENSKWNTDLLDEYFPHWKDPNTFSTEPYLKEEFQIRYDDDWIREILEEV